MGGIIVTEHPIALPNKNISRTISEFPPDVTGLCGHEAPRRQSARPCSYVVATAWRYGGPDPFCNAPAAPGSSYCPSHRALCEPGAVDRSSPGELPDDTASQPPPELAHLAATPLPEALDDNEAADALAGFARRRRDTSEEG